MEHEWFWNSDLLESPRNWGMKMFVLVAVICYMDGKSRLPNDTDYTTMILVGSATKPPSRFCRSLKLAWQNQGDKRTAGIRGKDGIPVQGMPWTMEEMKYNQTVECRLGLYIKLVPLATRTWARVAWQQLRQPFHTLHNWGWDWRLKAPDAVGQETWNLP